MAKSPESSSLAHWTVAWLVVFAVFCLAAWTVAALVVLVSMLVHLILYFVWPGKSPTTSAEEQP